MTDTYLAVGHVTIDKSHQGDCAGGTALYGSAAAHALGYDTRVVTATSKTAMDAAQPMLDGVAIVNVGAEPATTFEYEWNSSGRIQRMQETGRSITFDDVPAAWLDSDIWHLGPVASEVAPELVRLAPAASFVGVTPQGWMRATDEDGVVNPKRWDPSKELLGRANAIVFSWDDMPNSATLAAEWSEQGAAIVVTAAAAGGTLFVDGKGTRVPAFSVNPVRELGAGDIFAAAFFDQLLRGQSPETAARFASATAALAISGGESPEHFFIPTRASIEKFLANRSR